MTGSINFLPFGLGGIPGYLPAVKAGLAIKFFWLTAVIAGTGYLLFGYSKPEIRQKVRTKCDKFRNWVTGFGRDDEWDRFFEEETGA